MEEIVVNINCNTLQCGQRHKEQRQCATDASDKVGGQ